MKQLTKDKSVTAMSSDNPAALEVQPGELRICQVVDPLKTMKFILPKAVLDPLATDRTLDEILQRS